MDPVKALEKAYDQFTATMDRVTADQLTVPCACAGWEVHDLVNHVFWSATMFTLANEGTMVGDRGVNIVSDDPAAQAKELANASIASWNADGALDGDRAFPFGTFPASAAVMLNLGEIAVHTWDVAKSTGRPEAIDPEIGSMLLDFYSGVPLDAFRQAGAFGPKVEVPDSAPASDRMLGLLGFQP